MSAVVGTIVAGIIRTMTQSAAAELTNLADDPERPEVSDADLDVALAAANESHSEFTSMVTEIRERRAAAAEAEANSSEGNNGG